MSKLRNHKRHPMTIGDQRKLYSAEEDVSVQELIDQGARTTGIAAALLEELTLADLHNLGVRIRQAPA